MGMPNGNGIGERFPPIFVNGIWRGSPVPIDSPRLWAKMGESLGMRDPLQMPNNQDSLMPGTH